MSTNPALRLTAEEYLRVERAAEWKSEYIDGEMFAMAGASPRHAIIAANLVRVLGNQLLEGPASSTTPIFASRRTRSGTTRIRT
jgi:Uma2 family endonuclease